MARDAKYELLASTAQLRSMVCNDRLRNISWLRMRTESQTFRRAFRSFSLRLMRQKSGLIWQSYQALGLCPQIFLTDRVRSGINNSLMKATAETKLGFNKSANLEMKSVGVRHKNGGSSKIKPSAHPRGGHPSIKVMRLQLKFR